MAFPSGGDWLHPESLTDTEQSQEHAEQALFALRPLTLGELLDRTFALYRSHFVLFATIAAISASAQVVVQAVSLASAHTLMQRAAAGPRTSPALALHTLVRAQGGRWLATLVFFLVSAIANAATTLALGEVYLGRSASAGAALRTTFVRWYRWLGIGFWLAGSLLWPFLLVFGIAGGLAAYGITTHSPSLGVASGVVALLAVFGAFPAGVVLYLRNCLAIPAAVVERLPTRQAMRRSKQLAAGSKGRIFVVLLIASVLYLVVGVLESPASVLILMAPRQQHYVAQVITLLITFFGHTVVAPVGLIGLTLVYFDQRVRKEALDLQLLLEGVPAAASPIPRAAPLAGAGGAIAPPPPLSTQSEPGHHPLG